MDDDKYELHQLFDPEVQAKIRENAIEEIMELLD
jgi:hypothetical protein